MRHQDSASFESSAKPIGGEPIRPRGWLAMGALALVALLLPLTITDVPAVLDYPNHLARFFILAHPEDSILSKFYAPHWTLLPNLGTDLIGVTMLRLLSPSIGGRIVLALSLLAPLAGALLYARAAFGRWTWWSLGVVLVGYNGIFLLGFMNFLFGLGVALTGAAAWRITRRGLHPALAGILGLIAALAAFFCHLFGFAFFALLIGAQEAEALLPHLRTPRLAIRKTAAAAVPLAIAILPPAVLYLVIRKPNAHGNELWWDWYHKPWELFTPFAGYEEVFTKIVGVVTVVMLVLAWRDARRAQGVTLALAVLAVVYAVAPFAAGGGTFVDTRLPLMAMLLLFAGVRPQPIGWIRPAIIVSLVTLSLAHLVDVSLNWRGRADDVADLRQSLALIDPGTSVLVAGPGPLSFGAPLHGRLLPGLAPPYTHLPALIAIERKAFWPLLFADPSQQPIVVRPPYDKIAAPLGEPVFWAWLSDPDPSPEILSRAPYLPNWRAHFDYVLLLDPKHAIGSMPSGLTLMRAGDIASLYRVGR